VNPWTLGEDLKWSSMVRLGGHASVDHRLWIKSIGGRVKFNI
jgi:hypothetical protein